MSDFDKALNRTLFDSITADIEFDDQTLYASDMHRVVVGDEAVLLDAFAGSDFRDQLLKATRDAEALLSVDPVHKQPSDTGQARYITEALAEEVESFFEQRPVIGRLALKGVNTFSAPAAANAHPDKDMVCNQDVLQEDEVLIGTIYAVMYGSYLWAEPEAVRQALTTGRFPGVVRSWGGIVQLTNVKVCETDAIGHVDREFSSAFIPVHKKVFNWYLEAEQS